MAKILIIVPTYQQKREYMVECLTSLKNQTFKDFKCVIADDGSTNREETEALAKEYGFEYIWHENGGIGSIRNLGIRQVKDESFIFYISSDDALEPTCLETFYGVAQEHPDTILYSNYFLMDEHSNPIHQTNYRNFDSYEDFVMAVVESAKHHSMFVNFNLCCPTKFLQETPFWNDKRFGEDLSSLLEMTLIKKYKFHCVEKHLFRCRLSSTSTTTLKLNSIRENNIDTFRKINQKIGYKLFLEG